MNEPIRRLSVVALVMFLALMVSSSWIQFVQAGDLNADNRNVRTLYREFGAFRGPFVVSGESVVYSVPVDSPFNYQRTYANGPLYSHAIGYFSIGPGRSGLEDTENTLLNGSADSLFWTRLGDLFAGKEQQGASMELTLDATLQQVAHDALGDQRGAVVALDPRTGAILAMVSHPTYDPAALAVHSSADANRSYQALLADEGDPLINRAIGGDTYAPGSTFKLIIAAAALDAGIAPDTLIYAPQELPLPGTSIGIGNFGGATCSSTDQMTLADALRVSCNTAFADLGMDLGWGVVQRTADAFGWEESIEVPMYVTASRLPTDPDDAQVAMSSIGQFDVRTTPLQMAMVAAAIGNDGVLMKPYLVQAARAPDLSVIESASPEVHKTPLSPQTAQLLQQMMVGVVDNGTGTAARIPGVSVAGKTGTAETGFDTAPHTWFVAFAPADDPVIAIAVIVENGGSLGGDGTGGAVAAPIARAVMLARLEQVGLA
jgi:peptidoglycan glycosyltransferase